MIKMKNVFARTVLALVLIPSFWMTSVGTAAAEWVEAPGETVGELAFVCIHGTGQACYNPLTVTDTFFGFLSACVARLPSGKAFVGWIKYVQFVPDYSATNTALSGKCYYYEAGSSSGESGPHTWRWDE
jgi:hypothetical protein